ncbi:MULTISPECIES: flagellar hook-associated protein FlgL [Niveibacterium]|uniref:Flagellar hook-associated protein FlgL n=1 Tax=Niveibacterium microcysteis TaxID=2811415 RepID=A0ABX7MAI5_9RHOO|nr:MULTISPECIES: flagellar hook-associated protein FlgL [Niveibacterium]QSI78755.1 flagellar hook-associated protein FlgL [Niveibacterium microcysteis]
MRVSTGMIYDNGTTQFQNRAGDLLKLQQQISTGRRVVAPSDDPIAASSALIVQQAKGVNEQWATNRGSAKDSLQIVESKLSGVSDLIAYLKEKTIQAGNGSLSPADRKSIAVDVRARFDALVGLANSNDPQGGYLFAGFQTDTQPFVGSIASGVIYQGDQGSRALQISDSRVIPVSNSGNEVFMDIPNLNGAFHTSAGASNSGAAVIDDGSVTGTYTGNQYRIDFTGPGSYDVYDVTAGGGPISSGSYVSGTSIAFAGIQVSVSGTPAAGDTFSIDPGGYTDIFNTIKTFVGALENSSGAALNTQVTQTLGKLDKALDNVLRVTASVGSRVNEVQAAESVGSQADLQYASTISRLTDLDYAQASSDVSQKTVALQAAQQAFVKTTGLSLFNYIG